jgi:oxygen-dependent protoporphyrinogen oxidase
MTMHATGAGKRIVIVGGGVTGLTVCYRVQMLARERQVPVQVTLLEASGRLGGVIATDYEDDWLLERGPDCLITTKPWGVQLCEELELHDELIGTSTQHRQSFIVRHGVLRPVPQGLYLMAPASFWSFVTSDIVSWRGKLRMGFEPCIPRHVAAEDESLAQFVTRRLGREALERIAQPMVGGIYTADPAKLSLRATMPQFLEMEQQHGSLIRALRRNQRQRHSTAKDGTSGPRYGLFVSFKRGMQTLTDRLTACLPPATVRLHTRVTRVQRMPESSRWLLQVDGRCALEADALCLALPAPQAGHLVREVDTALATALDIPYASSAICNLVFRRTDVSHPLNGMGFVVPAVENRALIACSFSSVKFPGRAPDDHVLLRAFVGGALQHEQYDMADDAIERTVLQDLRQLLGTTGEPLHVSTSRHPQAMAQYHLGHLDRVAQIELRAERLPDLVLAGNGYHGVGIPDCIRSGEVAAQALLGMQAA